jgi:hypothetical protein
MGSEVTESQGGSRIFKRVLRQGFSLAVLYASLGLILELLHRTLPGPVYERAAGAIYGLPIRLLVQLDLQSALIGAVAQGRLPAWLAGAAVPAIGVAVILCASLALAIVRRFSVLVASFRQT